MLIDSIRSLFAGRPASPATTENNPVVPGTSSGPDPLHLAACALLLDIAHSDGEFSDAERSHLEQVLSRHFSLSKDEGHTLMELAEQERKGSIDHFRFTEVLRQSYDIGQKMVLAEIMWGLVLADGQVAEHESYLTRKISNLLDLEPGYLSAAKAAAARARQS